MSTKKGIIFLFIFLLSFSLSTCSSEESEKEVYLKRYCELLEVQVNGFFGLFSEVSLDVWNSMGFNDCPQESWEALSIPINVIRNGPRYWTMDRIKVSGQTKEYVEQAKSKDWGFGLVMNKVATLSFPNIFAVLGKLVSRYYSITEVERDTTFIWNENRQIFTLFNGTHSWVMQSFYDGDHNNMFEKLNRLGSLYRSLPAGWSFETCNLSNELHVGATGIAYVIQDEFSNTFQLYSTPSHLCSSSPSSRKKRNDEL